MLRYFRMLKLPSGFVARRKLPARLKHPNAVNILDFGVSDDGTVFMVMELVEGQSLRKLIKEQGPLLPSATGEILAQVCGAINEAHSQKVVHRDIKPDNIIVSPSPNGVRVKVLDFGIARLRDSSSLGNLTQTGAVMGTPHYMSPEQCLGEELDGRSDIYSLGVTLYEMLSGVVPFNSPTSMAVVVQQVNQAPAPLRVLNSSISVAVESVVMHALEKRRETRPQTAIALAEEFNQALSCSVPAGAVAEAGVQAIAPTVVMQTPWSTTVPPLANVTYSPSPSVGSIQRSRTLPVAVIIGGTAVLVAGAALTWFFLANHQASPTLPVGNANTSATAERSTVSKEQIAAGVAAVPLSSPSTSSPNGQQSPGAQSNGGGGQSAGSGHNINGKSSPTIKGSDELSRKLAEKSMELLKEQGTPLRTSATVSLELSFRPGPKGIGITGDYSGAVRTVNTSHTFHGTLLGFGNLPLRDATIEEAATKVAEFLAGLP